MRHHFTQLSWALFCTKCIKLSPDKAGLLSASNTAGMHHAFIRHHCSTCTKGSGGSQGFERNGVKGNAVTMSHAKSHDQSCWASAEHAGHCPSPQAQ